MLRNSPEGHFHHHVEVVVESAGEGALAVLSFEAAARGDLFTLHVSDAVVPSRPVIVRVADSRPVVVGGMLRHRVQLDVVDPAEMLTGTATSAPGRAVQGAPER